MTATRLAMLAMTVATLLAAPVHAEDPPEEPPQDPGECPFVQVTPREPFVALYPDCLEPPLEDL